MAPDSTSLGSGRRSGCSWFTGKRYTHLRLQVNAKLFTMQNMIDKPHKAVSDWYKSIGKKGGSVTSEKKKRALRENLKKANASRLRRRKMAKP